MNSVILIGRLTKDPVLNYTQSQTAVAHFTLAINRPIQSGQEEQADFIRITVFGKQAENCKRYLSKGRQVAVSGRIQTGSYMNRNGEKTYVTDVIGNHVEFIGSKSTSENRKEHEELSSSMPEAFMPLDEEEMPF